MNFSIDSLFKHRKVLFLSSHHRNAGLAYVVSAPDARTDDYRSSLWFTPSAGSVAPVLLASQGGVSSPQLSPDGQSIAFLSSRGSAGRPEPHLIRTTGGEAQALAGVSELNVSSLLQWHPDGRRLLALVSLPHAEDPDDDAAHAQRPLVINHLPYKLDGTGYTVGTRTHLFCLDAQGCTRPLPLTAGDYDVRSGAWSPDGRTLAYARTSSGCLRHRVNLWLVGPESNHGQITADFATVASVCWSPDGSRLAFAGNKREGDSATFLYIWSHEEGVVGPVLPFTLEGMQIAWAPDGRSIATVITHRGCFEVAVVALESGEHYLLPAHQDQVSTMHPCGESLVLGASSYTQLDELYLSAWAPEAERRRLTSLNTELSATLPVSCTLRSFEVPSGNGSAESVDAWILQPTKQQKGPLPLLVDFHGGPHSVALMDFAAHVYVYQAVAEGWTVVAPNPVGSNGYGKDFEKRLIGRWGELDLPQVESIVEQLRLEGIAGETVACAGKSYGGFLSAWAICHSDTFSAAVVSAPVANMQSHAGTSDSGYYVTPYAMDGQPDACPDRYRRLSPLSHVSSARGPVLLLNGAEDQRCPTGQCEELMAGLACRSRQPVQMVVYPGGTHSLAATGRPSHRRDYHQRIVRFLNRVRKAEQEQGKEVAQETTLT
ncbi:hypothetical protein B9Y61_08740 [Stenotrophomonas maltophilia]|nr:hypothetical protein B9Y61_08740 [Stenotrophomonas maltophilia]